MVNTRGKRKHARSSRTPEANEVAENALAEGQTHHSPTINVEEPNADDQYEDKVENHVEEEEKMPDQEEREKMTKLENNDEKITGKNNDNKAESEPNTSEEDETDDQDDLMWDDEELSEDDNEENVGDEDEDSEEEDAEKDNGEDDASLDEASEDEDDDGDEVSGEKTIEVAKGDEREGKAKEDEREAKAKEDGIEAKDHNIDKMEAGLKNDKNSNEKSRKKVAVGSSKKIDSKDKPESSRKQKGKKRVESMGMIFMCSSKTKSDCYQYGVLGLPESKKDIVEKIYAGMRLFLYDVDLKLMYGIYKAAGPGGYNIEPKAFRSQFPAQVRFAVMDDCLPLPEEKFKKVIKENYFTNTKFDCQLKAEQVKKLCKLFIASNKGNRSKKLRRPGKAENCPLPVRQERSRRRRVGGDERRLPPWDEHRVRPRKRPRKAVISPPRHQPLPVSLPSTVPSYIYERPSGVVAYNRRDQFPYRDRRDPLVVIHRDPSRDGYPVRDNPYMDGQDPYIERRESYRDGRDTYLRGRDSYVDGRASSYLERRDTYRDGRDLDVGVRSSYRDGRDLYLERRDPYTYLEAYGSYRRDPLLDGRGAYREEKGGEYRDSFRREEELRHPYSFEPGHRHEIGGRDSYVSYRPHPSYADPIYPVEYPSRAGLAREYHL